MKMSLSLSFELLRNLLEWVHLGKFVTVFLGNGSFVSPFNRSTRHIFCKRQAGANLRWLRQKQFLFGILIQFCVIGGFASEIEFEINGHGETRGSNLAGRGRDWAFSVSVHGCRWAIKINEVGYADGQSLSNLPDYYLAAYDGISYYVLESFEGLAKPGSSHHAAALRAFDPDPVLKTRELKVLWYLYASHCFFSGASTNRLPPIDALPWDEYRRGDYFRPGFSRLSESPPYLPIIVRRGHNFWGSQPDETPQAATLRKGELLSVSTMTNFLGLEIPLASQLECRLSIAGSNPWITMAITTRELRKHSTRLSFVPGLLPKTMVSEAMFWKSNPPHQGALLITNNWPSLKASESLYVKYRKAALSAAPPQRKAPSWLLLALGIAALGPLVFVVFQRTKKAQKH